MSDHIIRKWRRDCWQEMSAGGMRVGMPHISVLCTDALRMCLEIEHLRSELAERDAACQAALRALDTYEAMYRHHMTVQLYSARAGLRDVLANVDNDGV